MKDKKTPYQVTSDKDFRWEQEESDLLHSTANEKACKTFLKTRPKEDNGRDQRRNFRDYKWERRSYTVYRYINLLKHKKKEQEAQQQQTKVSTLWNQLSYKKYIFLLLLKKICKYIS